MCILHFTFAFNLLIGKETKQVFDKKDNGELEDLFVAPIGLCQKAASSNESKGFVSHHEKISVHRNISACSWALCDTAT